MAEDDLMVRIGEEDESFVRIDIEPDAPAEEEPAYNCAVCGQSFPAEGVYDADGTIVCVECWTAAHATQAQNAGASTASPARPRRPRPPKRPVLLTRVSCPHCWSKFAPQDVLWVSRHEHLKGDPLLGPDEPLRFLPSRFTLDGAVRDPRGMVCQQIACPQCHLLLPRPLVEAETMYISIIGGPSSGKSNLLAAMAWELRRLLPMHFGVNFNDADPSFNRALNQNEETLFLAADPQEPVKLEKTAVAGAAFYDEIRDGPRTLQLARPILFTMRPAANHPNTAWAAHLARVICVYDNAGEHFMPSEDPAILPLTQHLGSARVLLFMYDPTQDPRFRARLQTVNADPQLAAGAPTRRQELILIEAAARLRHFSGLPATHPIDRPLIVILPKADVWASLCNLDLSTEPIIANCVAGSTLAGVDMTRVEGISAIVREMLLDTAPEFIAAAEAFSSHVVYIPTSALGASPRVIEGREGFLTKPADIKPMWVTIPFLYMFAKWSHDLIGGVRVVGVAG